MGIGSGSTDLGGPNITIFNGKGHITSEEYNSAVLSFFARLNYDYKERYLVSASIRSDKSSKFAKGNRGGRRCKKNCSIRDTRRSRDSLSSPHR